jgi:bifunctional non-homologous end joining protein LigD
MDKMNITIEQRNFPVSNLDKLYWPQDKYTKGDLIKYYLEISTYMIEHLANRPIVFTRYPDGIEGKSFYQKNAPDYLPSWIETFTLYSQDSQRNINYILITEPAALAWLANQGCIEIHPWLSSLESLEKPDFLVIDLDPSDFNSFEQVVEVAQLVKALFDELKLKSYPKTSGSSGLHIYVPVKSIYSYTQIREFGRAVASVVTSMRPDICTIERTVNKRGPKIYVDYMQNVKGKTLCSAYSVRPKIGAPVSAPLKWEEVPLISPTDFNIKNMPERIKQTGDLFLPVLKEKQLLDYAWEKLAVSDKSKLH